MNMRDGFNLLATAPEGVVRLREMVLSLAMQGKLVAQHPNDEQANELLRRIQTEKGRLINERRIKRGPPLLGISESEKPFQLPRGWEWVRAQDICTVITDGDHQPPPKADVGVPFLVISNVRWGAPDVASASRFVPKDYFDELDWSKKPAVGDILYTTVGSFGIPAPVTDDVQFCFQRHIALFRPAHACLQPFLNLALASNLVFEQASASATGTAQKTVPLSALRNLKIPLPPIDEQARIVAKVSELMHLCDELEVQGKLELEQHARLVSTLFDALTASESPQALAENWSRVAAHFDLLLDRPQAVDALEQLILELAVRGLLVPQDSSDEPAGKVLDRITTYKRDQTASGRGSGRSVRAGILDRAELNELPNGWVWTQLSDLLTKLGSGSTPLGGKEVYVDSGIKFLRSQNIWNDGLRLEGVAHITAATHANMSGTQVLPGDLLFNITGASIGRCAVVPADFDEANVSQHVAIVRPAFNETTSYLHLVLISRHVQQAVMDVQVGVSREGLSMKKLGLFAIPFPPLEEQVRIVARVNELRAICKNLREHLIERQACQSRFADSLVEQSLESRIHSMGDMREMADVTVG
ncbi:hypothetical protein BLA23254_03840 [Burkholderia lata]|uniref:Type I restriction modification DNA specificity domain-containing protein n=1 Tax=Burkholderia lata (strain ATCC 17760 / DSM 23089 / LMG 22485 / NCIMB 9086 / R18194 / 383) TaxID=482957 RepID=A0A6P2MDM8_BURL3|nr:restriction endonuclease subunit S [Burkholderia lata]VWB81466.1 hypothetical protein BLA23254_03840 [Burkholderia lata]